MHDVLGARVIFNTVKWTSLPNHIISAWMGPRQPSKHALRERIFSHAVRMHAFLGAGRLTWMCGEFMSQLTSGKQTPPFRPGEESPGRGQALSLTNTFTLGRCLFSWSWIIVRASVKNQGSLIWWIRNVIKRYPVFCKWFSYFHISVFSLLRVLLDEHGFQYLIAWWLSVQRWLLTKNL